MCFENVGGQILCNLTRLRSKHQRGRQEGLLRSSVLIRSMKEALKIKEPVGTCGRCDSENEHTSRRKVLSQFFLGKMHKHVSNKETFLEQGQKGHK